MAVSIYSACCEQFNNSFSVAMSLRKLEEEGKHLKESDHLKFAQDPVLSQLNHLDPEFYWVRQIKSCGVGLNYISFRACGIIFNRNNHNFVEYPSKNSSACDQIYFGASSRLVQSILQGSSSPTFNAINHCRQRMVSLSVASGSSLLLSEQKPKENGIGLELVKQKLSHKFEEMQDFCCQFLKVVSEDDEDAARYNARYNVALQATTIITQIHPIILDCLGMNAPASLHVQPMPPG